MRSHHDLMLTRQLQAIELREGVHHSDTVIFLLKQDLSVTTHQHQTELDALRFCEAICLITRASLISRRQLLPGDNEDNTIRRRRNGDG